MAKIKFFDNSFLVIISLLFIIIFVDVGFSQCSLIDNSRSSLFITYERTAKVKIDGNEKLQNGIIFQLHNNSTCAVLITTGSGDKFYKPLPTNPTVLQRIRREIDYDLPDKSLVPDVQYLYQTLKESGMSVGGDMFFGFNLLGNRSIFFEVPFKHIDLRFASKLVLPFHYTWETNSQANVSHFVTYWNESLPEKIKQQIKKN